MGPASENLITKKVLGRADRYVNQLTELAHALKNDVVGIVNHYGVQAEQQNAHLQQTITDQYGLLNSRVNALEDRIEASQAATVMGVAERMNPTAESLDLANQRILDILTRVGMPQLRRLADVSGETAVALNQASAADGPLREAGLFMNGPLTVLWHPNEARLEAVNERIIEVPFVFTALADLAVPSRILDVGGGESTVGLSLASLGHHVDLVEPGGYPIRHPNLSVHETTIEDWTEHDAPDAVVLLSTIEHIGVGAYARAEAPDLDIDVLVDLWKRSRTGTRLVLTTPYGKAGIDRLQRTYDRERLTRLLTGWTIKASSGALQQDELTWVTTEEIVDDPELRGVALVVAERAEDPSADPWV